MSRAEPTLARATALMGGMTLASRATGFMRVAAMAYAIGGTESKVADTYTLANSTPNIIYQLIVGEVLATLLVPVFVESFRKRTPEASWRLVGSILNLALVAASIATVVTVVFAPQLMSIYTLNLSGPEAQAQREVGAFFLRLLMPQMIFYAMGMVFTGLLNAHKRFGPPAFAPLLNNLIVIATFIAFRVVHGPQTPTLASMTTGEKTLLAGGTTLGVVVMTLVLWPWIRSIRAEHSIRAFDYRDPEIRAVAKLSTWSLLYVVANQIGLWAINVLANGTSGGVAAYQTAWILYQLPYALFAASVFTFLAPRMAGHAVDRDYASLRRDVSMGSRLSALVVLPAAAGFVALGQPLIQLLLERGVFGAQSTVLFSDTFIAMSLGLGAFTLFQLTMRALYAMKDTRTPFFVNVVVEAALILAAIILYNRIGVAGLGLAHAISYAVGAIGGFWWLRHRLGGIDGAAILSSLFRITVASGVAGVAAAFASEAVNQVGAIAQVLLGGVALIATFLGAAYLLRVSELTEIVALGKARLNRRRDARESTGT
jgi:putative peptidoglycan lipid II flippase